MSFLINPFAFAVAGGDFESIATVTVGSGGAASIEFTSISGSYQHLQVRLIARSSHSANSVNLRFRANGDTDDADYAGHLLYGTGAAAAAFGATSYNIMGTESVAAATATANIFGAHIIDILDYASASKLTTFRAFTGLDLNGSGRVALVSALYQSTAALTSFKIEPQDGNFAQYSQAALYGVKAP